MISMFDSDAGKVMRLSISQEEYCKSIDFKDLSISIPEATLGPRPARGVGGARSATISAGLKWRLVPSYSDHISSALVSA